MTKNFLDTNYDDTQLKKRVKTDNNPATTSTIAELLTTKDGQDALSQATKSIFSPSTTDNMANEVMKKIQNIVDAIKIETPKKKHIFIFQLPSATDKRWVDERAKIIFSFLTNKKIFNPIPRKEIIAATGYGRKSLYNGDMHFAKNISEYIASQENAKKTSVLEYNDFAESIKKSKKIISAALFECLEKIKKEHQQRLNFFNQNENHNNNIFDATKKTMEDRDFFANMFIMFSSKLPPTLNLEDLHPLDNANTNIFYKNGGKK